MSRYELDTGPRTKIVYGAIFPNRLGIDGRAPELVPDPSSGGDPYECHCKCHDPGPGEMIDHCGPCCEAAPCGLDVISGMRRLHIAQCVRCQELLRKREAAE